MKSRCLNGEWSFSPKYDGTYKDRESAQRAVSAGIVYDEKMLVPSSWAYYDGYDKYGYNPSDNFGYPKRWSQAECGALKRDFCVDEGELCGRIVMRFCAVAKKSYVFLNGKYVCENGDMFLPFSCDVTDLVRAGTNTVEVLCRDFDNVKIASGGIRKTGLCGSFYGKECLGIWQDVYLDFYPSVYISDCEITTSVRHSEIGVNVCLFGAQNKEVRLTAHVLDGESEVMSFSCDSCGESEIYLSRKWENPILWDTENPHLYNMKITAKGDGVDDEKIVRFGFREFRAEGESFFLNGTRINLRGDSWHFLGERQMTKEYALNWCRICKERGVNSIRYHAEPHPEYYLDAADEMGILIVDESAIYGSCKLMDASNPDYIENCRDHVRRLVIRDRNHPSVVIWSLENEMRWVDGRNGFKKYIPELMSIIHANDRSGRLISLDGDNRMIDKAHTEVASLHYNIDGTVEQWDRQVPLTVGEHGGLWYICPQNSSMYMGLGAYGKHDECAVGISIKEQLYMEYARREYVSGISSFNFAHYFATAMPNEDVATHDEDICAPGTHPRVIPKYSLTINNGKLSQYPVYRENPICKYAIEGMRPVTVIPREYDRAFFDDKTIERNFDIYNDTLKNHMATLILTAEQRGQTIFSETYEYTAEPGIYRTVCAKITPLPVVLNDGKAKSGDAIKEEERHETLTVTARLLHDGEEKFTTKRKYKIYSAELKKIPVTTQGVAYCGEYENMEKLRSLFPEIHMVDIHKGGERIAEKLLIVGKNAKYAEGELTRAISTHIKRGGRVLICEQDRYAFASLTISKKPFIRAHASDYSHPIFSTASLSDDDFMYWLPGADEAGPECFLPSAFEKPEKANYNMLLECSYGDFNDGGDLWTPLVEYSTGEGALIASQLPVEGMADVVPFACLLLRNCADYLLCKENKYISVGALVNDRDKEFLDRIGAVYTDISGCDCHGGATDDGEMAERETYGLFVVSPDKYREASERLREIVRSGRKFIMPSDDSEMISQMTGEGVAISRAKIYAPTADYNYPEMKGVSRTDLFGCDKPPMSPREVVNRPSAEYAIRPKKDNAFISLAEGCEDIVWEDLFIANDDAEFYKRALVAYKDENEKPTKSVMAKVGDKDDIISEIIVNGDDEKSVRIYTRILSNLGVAVKDTECGKIKGENRYTLESMMALPYLSYQNYDEVFSYYSDSAFSLNNLGEGLYGWMKKYERHRDDGAFHIKGSRGKTYFCIAFVTAPEDTDVSVTMITNSRASLYVCGEKVSDADGVDEGEKSAQEKVHLRQGVNPIFVGLKCTDDSDGWFSLLFRESDGRYAQNLIYRTTVDEVDPK